jgi:hypothetical protein
LKQNKLGQMEKGKLPDGNGADHQFKGKFWDYDDSTELDLGSGIDDVMDVMDECIFK